MPREELYHQINEDLAINDDDLEREFQRQASKFAYYGALYARASKKHAREKLKLKELEATLSRDYRNFMKENEPKTRITESMVTTFMVTTDDWKEQSGKVIQAAHEEDLLGVAKEGFRQRAQMLIQLAKLKTDELWQTDLTAFTNEMKGRAQDYKRRKKSI